jgi:hypothetical protein
MDILRTEELLAVVTFDIIVGLLEVEETLLSIVIVVESLFTSKVVAGVLVTTA